MWFACIDCEEGYDGVIHSLCKDRLKANPSKLRSGPDVLGQLLAASEDVENSNKAARVCWGCMEKILKSIGTYMDHVWNELPQIFLLHKDVSQDDGM